MSTEKHADKGRKGRGLKVFGWILAGIFVFVLLIFIAAPMYLSSSGGTHMLLGRINKSVDGEVQMGNLSVGWFSGVKVQNLMFTDKNGQTSVKVQSVQTHPSYASLLGGKVKLGKTVIEGPQVDIKVSKPAAGAAAKPSSKQTPPATEQFALPIDQMDLELRDGKVTVEMPGDIPQKVSFTNIASTVQLNNAGQDSAIDVSMQVADGDQKGGEIAAKGKLAADKGWTLKDGDFNVTISKLQLASLKPLFALAGREQMDMAGELNGQASVRITDNAVQQVNADATITHFAQGTGQDRIQFEQPLTVSAQISGMGPDMNIETLKVGSQFCNVDCGGTMQSLDYRIDADLAQTQRFVKQFAPMDLGVGGKLVANGRMELSDKAVAFAGKGTFTQLTVQKEDVKTPAMDASLDYDVNFDKSAKLLSVHSANLDSPSMGTVRVKNMSLPLGNKKGGLALDMNADLNLEKTLSLAQVFAPKLAENQISGQLKAAAKIETTGSRIRFQTQEASIDKLKIVGKDKDSKPFVQDRVTLDGDIVVDTQDKTIDIKTLDLQGAQGETLIKVTKGQVERKVSQNQTEVRGNFEAEYDWKAVSALVPVSGLSVTGERKDAFQFNSLYPTDQPDKMLANLDAIGNLGFDSASYCGLNFGPTQLDMTIQKGLVNIIIPEATVNEGKMQFTGTIDLKENPMVLRLKNTQPVLDKIQINDAVTSSFLAKSNPMFSGAVSTKGFVSLNLKEMSIPLSKDNQYKPKIDGTLSIESMSMRPGASIGGFLKLLNVFGVDTTSFGADIAVLPTNFILDKGIMSYDSMRFVMRDKIFDFSGDIYLDDNQKLNMQVALPWTVAGDAVQQGQKTALKIPIGGTLTAPDFKLKPADLIKQQGQDLIKQGIQKGLEGLFN